MTNETIPHAKELLGDASTQVFLNQILLALVLERGGTVDLPVAAVDATGGYMLNVEIDAEHRVFVLRARKKQ